MRLDGIDLPIQYITSELVTASKASGRRPAPGEKPRKGMNKEEMQAYAKKFMEYVSEPSLLLMDLASAHTAKLVKEEFDSYYLPGGAKAVTVKYLKPKSAFLVSPLDKGAISEFKKYFRTFDRSALPLKKMAAVNAWKMVSNENLRAYIANCGWFTDERLDTIYNRFMKEVQRGIPANYKKISDFYDGWVSGAFKVNGIAASHGVPLTKPIQLEHGFLDGHYWNTYGSILQ